MAGVEIVVTVTGAGGSVTDLGLTDENGNDLELQVRHSQGACMPCRMNQDPTLIPFPGCNGNIAAKDPDDAKALAIGNLCQCTVMLAEKGHQHEDL